MLAGKIEASVVVIKRKILWPKIRQREAQPLFAPKRFGWNALTLESAPIPVSWDTVGDLGGDRDADTGNSRGRGDGCSGGVKIAASVGRDAGGGLCIRHTAPFLEL